MSYTARLFLFLVVNFAALGIGAYLQGEGPMGEWYQSLNKAPWTPPGVFFGIAWTTIMICFSIYMAFVTTVKNEKGILTLFTVQFMLNVIWNPLFFNHKLMGVSLFVLLLLLAVVCKMYWSYKDRLGNKSLLIMPYILWLIVAASLNVYSLIYN